MPDLSHVERLGAERRRAAERLEAIVGELRSATVALYHAGVRKVDLAHAAGVSRPTLDVWLTREEER